MISTIVGIIILLEIGEPFRHSQAFDSKLSSAIAQERAKSLVRLSSQRCLLHDFSFSLPSGQHRLQSNLTIKQAYSPQSR
jgi:hypothetical protein